MNRDDVVTVVAAFSDESAMNRVVAGEALRPDLAGMRMYERPLVGVAAAGDPLFREFRDPRVIGPHFRLPEDWLPGAQSVISLFFPYDDAVVVSNRRDPEWPSEEWLHARIEGQEFINEACRHLARSLRDRGYAAEVPSLHPDFWSWSRPAGRRDDGQNVPGFTSNWSERHVAHAAGLGTFGLSAVFISERGAAGRIGSVVTTLELEPDVRPYRDHDAYCSKCGACLPRCHVAALAKEGKNKQICSAFMDVTRARFSPRYGCGKCYVSVPCERRAPGSAARFG